jgi:hypothetical protein
MGLPLSPLYISNQARASRIAGLAVCWIKELTAGSIISALKVLAARQGENPFALSSPSPAENVIGDREKEERVCIWQS